MVMSEERGQDRRDPVVRPMPGVWAVPVEADREAREALDEERLDPDSGEDAEREGVLHELVNEPARPLTREEREAAEHDPGRPERVYAPASARVPKKPAPGDDRLIQRD
jgi:hypothetical protein